MRLDLQRLVRRTSSPLPPNYRFHYFDIVISSLLTKHSMRLESCARYLMYKSIVGRARNSCIRFDPHTYHFIFHILCKSCFKMLFTLMFLVLLIGFRLGQHGLCFPKQIFGSRGGKISLLHWPFDVLSYFHSNNDPISNAFSFSFFL